MSYVYVLLSKSQSLFDVYLSILSTDDVTNSVKLMTSNTIYHWSGMHRVA